MTDTDDAALAVLRDRLAEARDSFGELPPGPPVTAVFRRARRRRGGRWLAAAGASVTAASLAVTVAYTAQSQSPPVPRSHLPVSVHARLAASWSVDTNPNGTVTFRLRDTSDPVRLEQVLTQA